MAFNAKNLHYEKQEPAFLRKLRHDHGNGEGHHVSSIARPRNSRLDTTDEDDEPTMVNEAGETVTKEDYNALVLQKNVPQDDKEERTAVDPPLNLEHGIGMATAAGLNGQISGNNNEAGGGGERGPKKQKVAEVGAPKKRKQVKVVGEEVKAATSTSSVHGNKGPEKGQESKPKASKSKKIKLSFD